VTPLVTAPGDTNPSDATELIITESLCIRVRYDYCNAMAT